MTAAGRRPVTYGYDNDELLTNAGDETITRDPGDSGHDAVTKNGYPVASTGAIAAQITYDSWGVVALDNPVKSCLHGQTHITCKAVMSVRAR